MIIHCMTGGVEMKETTVREEYFAISARDLLQRIHRSLLISDIVSHLRVFLVQISLLLLETLSGFTESFGQLVKL